MRSLLALLLVFVLAGCSVLQKTQSELYVSSGPNVFRYNGDLLVAHGTATFDLGVRDSSTKVPFYSYAFDSDKWIVRVQSTKFSWTGKTGDPLPAIAREAFSAAEIAALNLKFDDATTSAPVKP